MAFLEANLEESKSTSRCLSKHDIVTRAIDYARSGFTPKPRERFSAWDAIKRLEKNKLVTKMEAHNDSSDLNVWYMTPEGSETAWKLVRDFEENYTVIKIKEDGTTNKPRVDVTVIAEKLKRIRSLYVKWVVIAYSHTNVLYRSRGNVEMRNTEPSPSPSVRPSVSPNVSSFIPVSYPAMPSTPLVPPSIPTLLSAIPYKPTTQPPSTTVASSGTHPTTTSRACSSRTRTKTTSSPQTSTLRM